MATVFLYSSSHHLFIFLEVISNNNVCLKFPCRTKQLREERHAGKNVRHGVPKETQKMLLTRKRGRGKGKNGEKRETQEEVCLHVADQ